DLNLKNVLGIGNQCGGLYLYNTNLSGSSVKNCLYQHDWHCMIGHPADPVLNVLKNSLQIDTKDLIIINFFNIENLEISNADERVDHSLNSENSSQSDSSYSFVPSENVNTFDFSSGNNENDAQSGDDTFPAQNEQVAKLEENVISEGNLNQNPSYSTQGVQNLRRSSRPFVFLKNYNDFVIDSKVKYGLENQSKSDYSLYTKSDKGVFVALLVYVDDIIIISNSLYEIEKFKTFLKSKFMIKDLGKLKYSFGIEVVDTDKGICLNQRKYVLDMLSEYGMLSSKPAKTSGFAV
ncbi:ribonuclease H-like domain-containing protein, partial [Tanacetum coccineum]